MGSTGSEGWPIRQYAPTAMGTANGACIQTWLRTREHAPHHHVDDRDEDECQEIQHAREVPLPVPQRHEREEGREHVADGLEDGRQLGVGHGGVSIGFDPKGARARSRWAGGPERRDAEQHDR